jgi:hypothetical protein
VYIDALLHRACGPGSTVVLASSMNSHELEKQKTKTNKGTVTCVAPCRNCAKPSLWNHYGMFLKSGLQWHVTAVGSTARYSPHMQHVDRSTQPPTIRSIGATTISEGPTLSDTVWHLNLPTGKKKCHIGLKFRSFQKPSTNWLMPTFSWEASVRYSFTTYLKCLS